MEDKSIYLKKKLEESEKEIADIFKRIYFTDIDEIHSFPNIEKEHLIDSIAKEEMPLTIEKYHELSYVSSVYTERQALVIDILQTIMTEQREHDIRAATKQHVEDHSRDIQQALSIKHEELKKTIEELKDYFQKSSSKRRYTKYSIVALGLSTTLGIINFFAGSVVIKSPFPELFIIVSILFYFIVRKLPDLKF